jgi:hypothetical protein
MNMFSIIRKTLIAFGVFTIAMQAQASWERVLTCDGGAAVLDVDNQQRTHLQLVIRDGNILGYLNNVGAVSLQYGQREAVIGGYQNDGVFGPGNFSYMNAYAGGGSNTKVYVNRAGSGLSLRFEQASAGVSCPDDCNDSLSSSCESRCQPWQSSRPVANWLFRDCR